MNSRVLQLGLVIVLCVTANAAAGYTSNIMITGFWAPTNEMLRSFSTNPALNPDGWIGGNWEGRGYNVYSYFPEFNSGSPTDNIGHGDFEVDYQDTSADFWRITSEIHPAAIITFGRGASGSTWQMEPRYKNGGQYGWVYDYRTPYIPTPSPPDNSLPTNAYRYSSLPMDGIRDAVNAAGLGVTAQINPTGNAGAFLCEYIGYHAAWYNALHSDPSDPYRNFAAGHIHVGPSVSVDQAIAATQVTLRTLTDYLDTVIPEPASGLLVLTILVAAMARRRHVIA
jgi:pyrrolidone-carboxylate peptidase